MKKMINYAIIRDQETDKNVAVVAHDPDMARAVFKARDANSPIDRALNLHYDRSIIIQEPETINGSVIMTRRRSIPKDGDYLNNFLDRAVKIPYEVRKIKQVESNVGLDKLLDKLVAEQLSSKNTLTRKKPNKRK